MLNSKDFWQFDTQNSFDFKGFLVKMVSYWKWFLASWIIAFIIAYNINVRKEKIYAVDTTIAVKEETRGSEGGTGRMCLGSRYRLNVTLT
jgi:uncharacterized protein involved in exopolysaccharide biosynthesis